MSDLMTAEQNGSSPETRIVHEPLTYDRHSHASYFRDLVDSELSADPDARRRLERHRDEMAVELRANPTSASTFAPPLWVTKDMATAPRPHRVLADAVEKFPLPAGAKSVNDPRLLQGATAQPQADGAPVSNTDITDAAVQGNVVTIVGNVAISQQLLDRSPAGGGHVDYLLYKDLTAAYDAQLELQMLNGSGVGQNILGLLNQIPTANQVTYTDATPTGSEMLPFIGQAMARIGDNRFLPPELWLLRTARWAWLAASEDLQGQALLLSDWGADGQGILSIRAMFDDAIPATFGAGGNQDAILCTRPSDIMLFESELKTLATPEPLSGTLEVLLTLMGHAAMLNLYPSGHASITGTGTIVQSGE